MSAIAKALPAAEEALAKAVAFKAEVEHKKSVLESEHTALQDAVHSTTCAAYLASRHRSMSAEEAAALRMEVEEAYRNNFAGLGCVCVSVCFKVCISHDLSRGVLCRFPSGV